jgi:quinoprotein glucose dehydrogenase
MMKRSVLVPAGIAAILSLAFAHAVRSAGAQSAPLGSQKLPTIWSGVYSKVEADQGRQAYKQLCSRCHGTDMNGGLTAPGLIGARFFDRWQGLRLGDVVAYIQAAMPREHEFYVSGDSARAIVSLMLQESRVPPGKELMSTDVNVQHGIRITRRPPAR